MYFVELKIVPDSGAPLIPGRRAEHSAHQHVYQALGVIVRPFFEDNGLVDIGSPRLPQLMTELTCLRSEPLPASESMCLEARLAWITAFFLTLTGACSRLGDHSIFSTISSWNCL
jgi:hypothetical protein